MKYLRHYIEEEQTKLFEECGAFFAFSKSQLEEQRKEGVYYISIGSGLLVDKLHQVKLMDGLKEIHKRGITQDIAENGKEAIIQRELANHEAHIVQSTTATKEALEGYGFSESDIIEGYKIFFRHCVENDLF